MYFCQLITFLWLFLLKVLKKLFIGMLVNFAALPLWSKKFMRCLLPGSLFMFNLEINQLEKIENLNSDFSFTSF